jgi:hypothetical protein
MCGLFSFERTLVSSERAGVRQVLQADDLACGNGTIRTAHPCEALGDNWLEWSLARSPLVGGTAPTAAAEPT